MTQTRLVVGVNLLWLVPGVVGGSEESTVRSLLGLADLAAPGLELVLYARSELMAAHPELAERFDILVAPSRCPGGKGARVLLENTWLAYAARSVDLMHHAGGTVPFLSRGRTVLTLHDLQPLDLPENFSAPKRAWLNRVLPFSVRRADLIVVPSRFTADRCAAHFSGCEDKLRVVRHGFEPGNKRPCRALADLDAPFVLLPGISYPHKRHTDVVEALGLLRDRKRPIHLVMTGRDDRESDSISEQIDRLGVASRVHRLGRVAADELAWLYCEAEVTVFPSLYEGFGYPALEAMAYGCPLVVVEGGAVAEVAGDAAILVPPSDPEAIADVIDSIVGSSRVGGPMITAGLERADRFSYRRNAEELSAVYQEALGLSE